MKGANGGEYSKPDYVVRLLKDSLAATKDFMSIEGVAIATSKVSGVPLEVIIGRFRDSLVLRSRQVSMFLARTSLMIDPSYADIGKYFRRTHATVLHSVKKVRAVIEETGGVYGVNEDYFRAYDSIRVADKEIEERGLDIAREIGRSVRDRLIYGRVAVDPIADLRDISLGEEVVKPTLDYIMPERIFVEEWEGRVVTINPVRRLQELPPGFFLFNIPSLHLEMVANVARESKRKSPGLDYRLNGVLLENVQS